MKVVLWAVIPLACAQQLPETCKASPGLLKAIHDESSARVYDAVGAWFADRGDMKCALAAFEEAARLEPGSSEAHYDLGVAHVRMNQLTAAVKEFRIVVKSKPDMVAAHNSLGSALMDLGKNAEAEAAFRDSLKIDPKSVFALDHLARFWHWNTAMTAPSAIGMRRSRFSPTPRTYSFH